MPYKDPEKRKAKKREYDRKKRGTPLDQPVAQWRRYETKDEAILARRRRERKYYAKAQGLTVEELDARIAARQAEQEARKSCPNVKVTKPKKERARKATRSAKTTPFETMRPSVERCSTRRIPKPGALWMRAFGRWP